MYRVIKRDGSTVPFNIQKISNAIKKAFIGCKKNYTDDVIDLIALRVTSDFEAKIKDEMIDVEDIQDSVEKVLSEAGYADVSKAYILYRKQRENVRNISATTLDYKSLVNSYLNALDWRVKENSTVTYSIGGLILSNSGAITANYWLSEAYDEEIANAHRNGDIHIHDLSMLSGYCAGWSLKQLLLEGVGGVEGKITRGPAKHLDAIIGGKNQDFTYGECKKEMDMINKAFIEVMIEGDYEGRGFQYPIPTYSITKDFDWSDTENNELLFEMTAKYGTPYFSNYVNSDMKPSDIRSMCCRLRLDLRELRKKSGGYFGSGESTGSIGVVTINLPRIAYLSKNADEFYTRLDAMMDISARSLKTKRTVITKLLDNGLYPYTKKYLGTFAHHFSTIGIVGMNEACLNANWIQEDLSSEASQSFAKDVLNHMRERLKDYQVEYGDLYNLEATPAESTAYRLAKHDKEKYPEMITANQSGTPYYTNSSHLPVNFTEDVFTALDIQDDLQTLYTSGTVFHAFLGERLSDWKSASALVRKIAENYKLPYYTLSPTYSICKKDGYLNGEVWKCPKCGGETEVYSRITGYYRPVKNWNAGKNQEFKDRTVYEVEGGFSQKKKVTPVKKKTVSSIPVVSENNLLFTTKTCANCRMIQKLMNEKKIPYLLVDGENNPNLVKEFDVMQAPTLVVVSDVETKVYAGVNEILAYIQKS